MAGPVLQLRPLVWFGRVKRAGSRSWRYSSVSRPLSVGVGGGAVAASGAAKPSPTGAFAQHVLDEAILPPGARVTTVVRSRTLEGPPAEPGVSGLHDAHRFYLLDESMEAVESYLKAHVPWDATQLGYGKSGTMAKGILSVNLSYDLPVSGPHNDLAELSYLSVATGSAAELRVDALVVWDRTGPPTSVYPGTVSSR